MAAWIKMSLGMEVGLSPGDFVLDGDPAPPPKGHSPSPLILGPCLLWPNGWTGQDATWYSHLTQCGLDRGPGHIVLDGRRHVRWHRPQFLAHVYCGQTVAHLSTCHFD